MLNADEAGVKAEAGARGVGRPGLGDGRPGMGAASTLKGTFLGAQHKLEDRHEASQLGC